MLRGKYIAINAHIGKKMQKINDLSIYFKRLGKWQVSSPKKVVRKREVLPKSNKGINTYNIVNTELCINQVFIYSTGSSSSFTPKFIYTFTVHRVCAKNM